MARTGAGDMVDLRAKMSILVRIVALARPLTTGCKLFGQGLAVTIFYLIRNAVSYYVSLSESNPFVSINCIEEKTILSSTKKSMIINFCV